MMDVLPVCRLELELLSREMDFCFFSVGQFDNLLCIIEQFFTEVIAVAM